MYTYVIIRLLLKAHICIHTYMYADKYTYVFIHACMYTYVIMRLLLKAHATPIAHPNQLGFIC